MFDKSYFGFDYVWNENCYLILLIKNNWAIKINFHCSIICTVKNIFGKNRIKSQLLTSLLTIIENFYQLQNYIYWKSLFCRRKVVKKAHVMVLVLKFSQMNHTVMDLVVLVNTLSKYIILAVKFQVWFKKLFSIPAFIRAIMIEKKKTDFDS